MFCEKFKNIACGGCHREEIFDTTYEYLGYGSIPNIGNDHAGGINEEHKTSYFESKISIPRNDDSNVS